MSVDKPKLKRIPKPFGSYVIVRPKDVERTSAGGIIIPVADEDRKRGSITEGTVLALGPLAFKDEMNPSCEPWYKVGDRVIFVKYGGKYVKCDNELYIVFRYEDVMCGIDDDVDFQDGEKDA